MKNKYLLVIACALFSFIGTVNAQRTLAEVATPDGYDALMFSPTVYNGVFTVGYSGDTKNSAFMYDGSDFTEIVTDKSYQWGTPVEYQGNLYLKYKSSDNSNDLMKYDGTSITEIASPDYMNSNNVGFMGGAFVYNDSLFMTYRNSSLANILYNWDGTKLDSLKNTPEWDNQFKGYSGYVDILDDNLYLSSLLSDKNRN